MIGTPYDALRVANYIVHTSNVEITNIKLQKILYLIQFMYLKRFGKAFFSDPIEAWRVGPCVPSVYFMFTSFGSKPLSVRDVSGVRAVENILDQHKRFITFVVEKTSKLSVFELMDITQDHTAWIDAYNREDQTMTIEDIMNTSFTHANALNMYNN